MSSIEIRHPDIPLLPGTTFRNPKRTNFRKSHAFDKTGGIATFNHRATGIGGEELESTKVLRSKGLDQSLDKAILQETTEKKGTEVIGDNDPLVHFHRDATQSDFVPAFVAYDRLVLRFSAFFNESIKESRDETGRVRVVYIDYYVEDGSIAIYEPQVENSGLPQGQIIRRHRVLRQNATSDEDFITLDELRVGHSVNIYSITYNIFDANSSTRDYIQAAYGEDMEPAMQPPSDDYTLKRTTRIQGQSQQHVTKKVEEDSLTKFLEHDRRVLRFYALWDDRDRLYGYVHQLIVHYFLSDDTIEVVEVLKPNCGKDPTPLLLRRQKLPLGRGPEYEGKFLSFRDVYCGAELDIFGRHVLVYDCDPFTRDYYVRVLGANKESYDPLNVQVDMPQPDYEREIPPYNGFGSEEDSLGCCLSLVAKPPKKDFQKLMKHDIHRLRFQVKYITDRPIDAQRKFMLTYYLGDDTLSIYEKEFVPGIVGGKFLDRRRVKNPDTNDWYRLRDIAKIGSQVHAFGHHFEVIGYSDVVQKFCEEYFAEGGI